jgi:hypothetical protein
LHLRVPFRGLKSANFLLSELQNLGVKALLLLGSQLRCVALELVADVDHEAGTAPKLNVVAVN